MNGARSARATAATARPTSRPSITSSRPLVSRLHRDQGGQQRRRHEVDDPGHPRLLHPGRRHRQPGELQQVAAQRRDEHRRPQRGAAHAGTAGRGRPASATATTAATTCTPGGTNGVSASATTAPPTATRRWTAASGKALAAAATAARGTRPGRRRRARPARCRRGAAAPSAPTTVVTFQTRKIEAPPARKASRASRAVGGGDRQRRRLVDDPVRRPQPAQHAPRRQQRHEPDAVDGVAGAEQQRAADGGQAAAPGPEHADQGELRGPGEHQQRQRRRLPDVQPGRDGRGTEGRAVETDREAQPDGVAERPGADGAGTLRRP